MSDVKSPARAEASSESMTPSDWLRAIAAWCPDYADHLDDAADHIDALEQRLSPASPPAEALPSQTSGAEAVARLAYGYELMHTALCHIAGTSGADRHWYVHKAQEVTARITRVGEVTKDSNPGKPGDCLHGYRQFVEALAKPASEPAGGGVRGLLPEDQPHAWPALKKALWLVVTGEQLNDGRYVNAYELTDKLYAAALSSPASSSPTEAKTRCTICNGTGVTDQSFGMGTSPGECPVCSRSSPAEAEALQVGVEAKAQGFVDGYEAALRDVQVFRIKIAEPFDSTFQTHKGFVTDMLKVNAGRLRASLSSAPAQEDGSKDLGAHPRGSGQTSQNEGV